MLFDKVCEHLNLLERDYFGLLFQDHTDQKVCIKCELSNFSIKGDGGGAHNLKHLHVQFTVGFVVL